MLFIDNLIVYLFILAQQKAALWNMIVIVLFTSFKMFVVNHIMPVSLITDE